MKRIGILGITLALILSGCSSRSIHENSSSEVVAKAAKIAISTENGLGNIKPQDTISVSVTGGELDSVDVIDQNGEPAAGKVADGKWKADTGLPLQQTVTIITKATGTDGNQVSEQVQAQTPDPQWVVAVDFLFAGGVPAAGCLCGLASICRSTARPSVKPSWPWPPSKPRPSERVLEAGWTSTPCIGVRNLIGNPTPRLTSR